PIELQRMALEEAVRASVEAGDLATAAAKLDEFESVGMSPEIKPAIAVLSGRLAERLGQNYQALAKYRAATEATHPPVAAQAKLREVVLRYKAGDLNRDEVISALETLTTIWRGDETEIEALQLLARLYTEEHRYRDAFYAMRTAVRAHPNSEMAQRIQ